MPTSIGSSVSIVGMFEQVIRQDQTWVVDSYLIEIDDIDFFAVNTSWKSADENPNKSAKHGHPSTPRTKRPLVVAATSQTAGKRKPEGKTK